MNQSCMQKGATLIEVLVAVLIFSIGVLAVVGLQAVAIQTTSEAKYRADASFIASTALSQLWGDPANIATYAGTTNINELPNGKRTIAVVGNRVEITINWQSPQDASEREFLAVGFININN